MTCSRPAAAETVRSLPRRAPGSRPNEESSTSGQPAASAARAASSSRPRHSSSSRSASSAAAGGGVAPAVERARLEAGAAQLQRRPLDGGRAPGEQDGRAFLAGVSGARGAQAGSPLLVRSAGWIGRRSLLTPNSGVPMAAAPFVTSAQCAWFASWMLKQALSAV